MVLHTLTLCQILIALSYKALLACPTLLCFSLSFSSSTLDANVKHSSWSIYNVTRPNAVAQGNHNHNATISQPNPISTIINSWSPKASRKTNSCRGGSRHNGKRLETPCGWSIDEREDYGLVKAKLLGWHIKVNSTLSVWCVYWTC